jgi:hypothetical protein
MDDIKMRVAEFKRLKLHNQLAVISIIASYLIDDLWQEIERLRFEREWRPIETAPKDGRSIICFAGEGSRAVSQCRWGYDGSSDRTGWLNCNGSLFGSTHWLPLPAPPEGK